MEIIISILAILLMMAVIIILAMTIALRWALKDFSALRWDDEEEDMS